MAGVPTRPLPAAHPPPPFTNAKKKRAKVSKDCPFDPIGDLLARHHPSSGWHTLIDADNEVGPRSEASEADGLSSIVGLERTNTTKH
jgi:hypothetical protein